jgi:hypothetical protein
MQRIALALEQAPGTELQLLNDASALLPRVVNRDDLLEEVTVSVSVTGLTIISSLLPSAGLRALAQLLLIKMHFQVLLSSKQGRLIAYKYFELSHRPMPTFLSSLGPFPCWKLIQSAY